MDGGDDKFYVEYSLDDGEVWVLAQQVTPNG
jgi:hypothetical protein